VPAKIKTITRANTVLISIPISAALPDPGSAPQPAYRLTEHIRLKMVLLAYGYHARSLGPPTVPNPEEIARNSLLWLAFDQPPQTPLFAAGRRLSYNHRFGLRRT
jgi:hypothetical protein